MYGSFEVGLGRDGRQVQDLIEVIMDLDMRRLCFRLEGRRVFSLSRITASGL